MFKQIGRSVLVMMVVAFGAVLPANGQGSSAAIAAPVISALDSCTVVSDKVLAVQVHVGPGANRSVLLFLGARMSFGIQNVTTLEDDTVWLQLINSEVNRESAAAEMWIDAADVTLEGDCEDSATRFDPYSVPVITEPQSQTISAVNPTQPTTNALLPSLLNQITSDSLMTTIQTLQDFHTRHVNSSWTAETQGVGAAASYLYGELLKVQVASNGNLQAYLHPFTANYNGNQTAQNNVVGVITGTQPRLPAIVIGAHYDSRTDDLTDSNAFAPGADDNGSGVAGILEIARIMSQIRPRATMIFVLFAAEEVGRQGSIAFVHDYIQSGQYMVRGMINVDTIGSTQDPYGNVNDSELRIFSKGPDDEPSRDMARMIHMVIENYDTDLKLQYVEEIDRQGRYGDHFSFNEAGIPAVRIIEALEDTPHREGRDTIEYIEPAYLRKSVRTLAVMMLALSDSMAEPSDVVISDLENGELRVQWQPVEGATAYLVALRRQGEPTFVQHFLAAPEQTAWVCGCFARFSSISVAAVNENGLAGLLTPEIPVPAF